MRVVILGTGTDVGKTYVTCCLAQSLRAYGSVQALKPVESGVDAATSGDAGAIAAAAGHAPSLSPWRLRRGVSPHLAAREQGLTLDLAEIVAWIADEERRSPAHLTLIETAGGAFSPLAPGVCNVDLAAALSPALWLLVAPDALGVLHDVTATLRALPRAPDAVVLSGARPSDASTGSNAAELSRLGIVEVLETVPRGDSGCAGAARWLAAHPTYKSSHD
ncbi:MAG TPA: dethiobiotin synthase [Polyangiaceae bacterium]|nr:dethiobiotin synthase [Polyangiaceae bacterium]